MNTAWETQLATFLNDLSGVQSEMLEVLTEKRQVLAESKTDQLMQIAAREEQLVERLQGCLKRREELLEEAERQGLPSDSIKSLSQSLPGSRRKQFNVPIREAEAKSRMLRMHALTNWVIVQRTLIHLSQMLEVIATRGRMNPTYENNKARSHGTSGGVLVDKVA